MVSGILQKLKSLYADPICYRLSVGGIELPLNDYVGKTFSLTFLHKISCVYCGVNIKKSYAQGYCFPCSQKLARCDLCILKPERCHYHLGTCREPEWGLAHCFMPHIVYLANTSGFKVGITRETQIPTRWIDQGARQALPILRVKNRYHAGLLEAILKNWVSDKTNWRTMLASPGLELDLGNKRDQLLRALQLPLNGVERLEAATLTTLQYPILEYPSKIKALRLEKTPEITGTLLGVKGQYLILESGVINIRRLSGYMVKVVCNGVS